MFYRRAHIYLHAHICVVCLPAPPSPSSSDSLPLCATLTLAASSRSPPPRSIFVFRRCATSSGPSAGNCPRGGGHRLSPSLRQGAGRGGVNQRRPALEEIGLFRNTKCSRSRPSATARRQRRKRRRAEEESDELVWHDSLTWYQRSLLIQVVD